MTSSQHGPYTLGCTRTTMLSNNTSRSREAEEIYKTEPNSDRRLQLACVKPESLVMAHQLRRREYVPGPCTHRPSHHGSRLHPKCTMCPTV
jgi:hypothetical protein